MVDSSVFAAIGALAGAVMALVWIAQLVRFHRAGARFPELGSDSHERPLADAPLISVVISGKDEQAGIEACVRSVLGQDYPNLELVVVDDRSTDSTRAILDRLSSEFGTRLQVLTIDELPPGWGGQSHGLHCGVGLSRGEWLCFTDADCQFDSPSTLSMAWREAETNDVQFLSILPRMNAPTAWEKVYLPLCSFMLLMRLRIDEVNDPCKRAAYANGAFMMISRATYADLGGHQRVRGYVNDDVRLAELAKQTGVSLRVVGNQDLLSTRMYPTMRAAWSGWSRNFYGTLHSSRNLRDALLFTVSLFVAPWALFALSLALAAWISPAFQLTAACWAAPVLVSHLGLSRLYRAFRVGTGWSLAYLPGAVFVSAMLARSALRARRRAGTTWHGVHYDHPG